MDEQGDTKSQTRDIRKYGRTKARSIVSYIQASSINYEVM